MGLYCYGVAPARILRVATTQTADDGSCAASGQTITVPPSKSISTCPYWKPIGHGRVRCKLTGIVASLDFYRGWHLAEIFYRKHPRKFDRDTGYLIGDMVKECKYNEDYPEDSSTFEED